MGADHLLCAFLVLGFQWILIAVGCTSMEGLVAIPLLVSALLLPVPGYVWALRDAPVGVKAQGRGVRIVVIGLVAFGLSVLGFALGMALFALGGVK
jgi:hypothetical protein